MEWFCPMFRPEDSKKEFLPGRGSRQEFTIDSFGSHLDSVPASVSILGLIKSSPQYRAMLYDDLEKAQMPRDASPEVVRGALVYQTPEGSARHCNEPLKGARDHFIKRRSATCAI